MSLFRTNLSIPPSAFRIRHDSPSLAIGSCFVTHIGQRLQTHKFPLTINPFGILYNPVSIAKALDILNSDRIFVETDLFHHNGLWHSFAHHGHFSTPDKTKTLALINHSVQKARQHLKTSKLLIISLGTAHVFKYRPSQQIVANCHKLPNDQFERKRLSVPQIIKPLSASIDQLKRNYPELNVLLTVSPVRHLRDGHIENQRSKASLILAVSDLLESHDYYHYFPSYELLMDDLRNYRFYNADMIHPSPIALDYIWNHFQNTFFDQSTRELVKQIAKIKNSSSHRPLHPGSEADRQFVQQSLNRIQQLEHHYPGLDFSEEKKNLERS